MRATNISKITDIYQDRGLFLSTKNVLKNIFYCYIINRIILYIALRNFNQTNLI